MGNKHKLQKEHELLQIRTMRLKNRMTDTEICKKIGISRMTLYRYKQEIYKEDKEILTELIADNMSHEIVEIFDSLHETIENMRKIARYESNATAFEKIEAERMKIQCHNDMINLLSKGPYLFANVIAAPSIAQAFKQSSDKPPLANATVTNTGVNVNLKIEDDQTRPEG